MKHSMIKQTIVETASNLFYKNGYNLTGINEIIKEAGIAKATLYSHFKSKDDLCIAYLQHKNSTFLKDITAFTQKAPKGKKQVLAIFDFLSKFFVDKDFNGCWCINTVSEIPRESTKILEEIQNQKNQFIFLIEELVDNNLEKRTSRQRNLLAKQIYLLYESAVAEAHLHADKWPIDSAKKIGEKVIS